MIVSFRWVYDHLICEFDHWDICLDGLIDKDGQRMFCKIIDPCVEQGHESYILYGIEWNLECDEYLEDYRKAYPWWFYMDGERSCDSHDKCFKWFGDKWKHRDPIKDNIVHIPEPPLAP